MLAVVFQSQVRDWFKEFFLVNIKAYRDDIDLQNLIDSLQRMVTCPQGSSGFLRNLQFSVLSQNLHLRKLQFSCVLSQNHCCGAQEPDDWDLNDYFSCNVTNRSREKCGVPFSCCLIDPAVSPCSSDQPIGSSGSTASCS